MKSKCKKLVTFMCLSVCILTFSASAVYAVSNQMDTKNPIVKPYMTYISDASCKLTVKNGQASLNADVSGYFGEATKCSVVIELQEKSGSSWKSIGTWSNTENGDYASVSGSKAVTSGKTYRAKAVVTVWAGTQSESRTILSGTQVG